MNLDNLLTQARRWYDQDPDSDTKAQLELLIGKVQQGDDSAVTELSESFAASLQFGTAGLRGALGPGPNRMNRVTVLKAAAGLGNYLLRQGFAGEPIVIGFDGRHKSDIFARDSAQVFSGLGFSVYLFDSVAPTPLLAYSIRKLNACAGVMVTASHNPAADNGYKVYLGDGRQIVPPADIEIAEQIALISDVRALALGPFGIPVPAQVRQGYVSRIAALIAEGPVPRQDIESVHCVYTAMHGVGWQTFSTALTLAGFSPPVSVIAQQDPDPDFPTVAFPNPEESGALDLAIQLAQTTAAELIVANDPDADRLAIAIRAADGAWTMLRGDQVGVLLGWWLIRRSHLLGKEISGAFANSIVSSALLENLARKAGLDFASTLTGFKWVSRVPNLIYGYEEALGYCVDPSEVADKDGISSALVFLELFAYLKGQGKSAWELLDEIAIEYGLYSTDQISVRIKDISQMQNLMNELRENPIKNIGEFSVMRVIDLATGIDLPATDGLIFELAPHEGISWARIIVRPSGTEPKIKSYLEVKSVLPDLAMAKQVSKQSLAKLASVMQPLLTGEAR
ncbi:MAG: phospho-sugar mutase [Actinomycetales bacterium]|nr:phospho-sugar mutase [Actinomycetales bacterium]